VQVDGKAAHHADPDRQPVSGCIGRQRRPPHRVLGGHGVNAVPFEIADELLQQPAGVGELKSQRPPQIQVVGQRIAQ
jgi:uncharacterized protein YjlB